ncbi:osmoprotectant uptake system permease [Kaistia algarum]|uniref:ABC transporter permease n=1 Tax=Kaistia algarum TaxID=2083279 RepID=UPI000CE804DC|nr:ABC transporter permease [Kaistia algarum]MCX5515532.1 ABC transporter permease [Kaistia algarum]PPE81066.1 osmoprotectant uptake system permease [Kaistia algarum]
MRSASEPAGEVEGDQGEAEPRLNRVRLLLVAIGLIGAVALDFLSRSPNRLLSGQPVPWGVIIEGGRIVAFAPAVVILVGIFMPGRRGLHLAVALAAAILAASLLWLAGDAALRLFDPAAPAARTSFGGAFWILEAATVLIAADAMQRLGLSPAARLAAGLALTLPTLAVLFLGGADSLSILKEYANRREVFAEAVLRHIQIVGATLVPTLLIGIPLGIAAFRSARLRGPLFAVLNVIQTIPSIALFGLLIAPLSGLVAIAPALGALGISGIGATPAIIALTLYSLLPIARSTAAGLEQVPVSAVDAATGMGMTRGQIFRSVQAPLALPVLLAGLRVTVVQAVGMTAVAALIGAGGLGAIIFQGLAASALDLVLLGVVPLVALAVAADVLLKLAISMMRRNAA